MSEKISTIALVLILGVLVFSGNSSVPTLSGLNVPDISAGEILNSSSSLPAGGQVIITNASNTGLWFRITNASNIRVWCFLGSSTTSLSLAGQLLSPITSSTGNNVLEMYRAKVAVTCLPDAASAFVSWSYSGR